MRKEQTEQGSLGNNQRLKPLAPRLGQGQASRIEFWTGNTFPET